MGKSETCEVCGCPVEVVGRTTKSYKRLNPEADKLAKALNKAVDCMKTIYDERKNCGDRDAECPLQDAYKDDEWSLLSRLTICKQALNEYRSEK